MQSAKLEKIYRKITYTLYLAKCKLQKRYRGKVYTLYLAKCKIRAGKRYGKKGYTLFLILEIALKGREVKRICARRYLRRHLDALVLAKRARTSEDSIREGFLKGNTSHLS